MLRKALEDVADDLVGQFSQFGEDDGLGLGGEGRAVGLVAADGVGVGGGDVAEVAVRVAQDDGNGAVGDRLFQLEAVLDHRLAGHGEQQVGADLHRHQLGVAVLLLAGQFDDGAGHPEGIESFAPGEFLAGDGLRERADHGAAEVAAGPLDVGLVGAAVGVTGKIRPDVARAALEKERAGPVSVNGLDESLGLAGKIGAHLWITFRVGRRALVAPREKARVAHGVHQHRQRGERLAVVEAQHLDARVVGAVGIQPHHGAAVDGQAPVDAEADTVLAVADRDGQRVGGGLFRRGGELVDQFGPPAEVLDVAGTGVVVRGADEDVRRRHAGLGLDAGAGLGDHLLPRADGVEGDDGGLGLAVVEHQHPGAEGIAHAVDDAAMTDHGDVFDFRRGDIHLGDAGFEVRRHGEAAVFDALTRGGAGREQGENREENDRKNRAGAAKDRHGGDGGTGRGARQGSRRTSSRQGPGANRVGSFLIPC